MPIVPLPQFEADLKELQEEDRKAYEALKAPKTLVVRFGSMKLIGEFPYDGEVKPGCGSKVVVRSFRGTEMGEMLTSTCPNSGCGKSVSRKQMLEYIENSGGRDYPFFSDGKVLRIATKEDVDRQEQIEQSKHALNVAARSTIARLGLDLKIVEVEPILGGERLTVFYLSEQRVEYRDLVRELSHDLKARIEMRQVGARDEARLTADYEKCGQYCCCKNFLKVLKPISMRAAKMQKATLEPLKISGRCGRLMCCLRYEESTYEDLRTKLPRKKSRVGTPDGDGTVVDGQILTQLVLVLLDEPDATGQIRQVAVPVEELSEPVSKTAPPPRPLQGMGPGGPRQGPPPRGPMPRPGPPQGERPERGRPPGGPPREGAPVAGQETQPRPQARPDQRRPDQGRPDQRRQGPPGRGPGGPPPQGGPVAPQQPRPAPRDAEDDGPEDGPVGEVMFDAEGNEIRGGGGGGGGGPGPQGGGDEARRKRRRRRRRRGPGEGGPGGGGPGPGGGGGGGPG